MWPNTIPYDLECEMQARDATDWKSALRAWSKTHKLRLKLQWFADLEREMETLESYRFIAGSQDRWVRIKEWLSANNVPVPSDLPTRPELPTDRY